jgi:L-serine dehydratase
MMRSALATAVAALTGRPITAFAQTIAVDPVVNVSLDSDLNVVRQSKGPVMTLIDEFYKVGPGPSSSHTIGPMRITYDFYQRATKLPPADLAKATKFRVNLFGSLSATGKGHGTERASLAGLTGMEPATTDPAFLDGLAADPSQVFQVKLGSKEIPVSLADVIYDETKGEFPHPNTMKVALLAGETPLLEQEYYSVGGGFIEWKGYEPPAKAAPKYPYETMAEILAHAQRDNITLAQLAMANETTISGRSEAEINAFLDKIIGAMRATVKTGSRRRPACSRGRSSSRPRPATSTRTRSSRERGAARHRPRLGGGARGIGRERARALVITRRRADLPGVLPAVVYSLGPDGREAVRREDPRGLLAGALVGYLCKHNATLSAAEGGCQAEIGVASAMGAACIAAASDESNQVAANGAGAALEHHLGMTCDPVAASCRSRASSVARSARSSRGPVPDGAERDPGEPPRRHRLGDHRARPDRQGDELEVQGDLRRRHGRFAGALLKQDDER